MNAQKHNSSVTVAGEKDLIRRRERRRKNIFNLKFIWDIDKIRKQIRIIMLFKNKKIKFRL